MFDRKNKKAIKEPNFFIVGAAKCGTTSLANNLRQHPQIFMSPRKEPFYFVKDAGYRDFDEYMALFKNAGDAKAIGEASTGYLFDEDAPSAIKKQFPDAKIIIMLRNPADMAFSHWRHMRIVGNETKSFEEATSDNERRYRTTDDFKCRVVDWWATYLYLERALYYHQVKRWLDVFGEDNVRVYIFEEFTKNQEKFYKDIFKFLGVDVNFTPNFTWSNEGGELRSGVLKNMFLFTKTAKDRFPHIRKLLPVPLRAKIQRFLLDINVKKGGKIEMHSETRRKLEAFFMDDVHNLEKLLGRGISAWKPNSDGH